ncbi:LOW QUALITY PROTEIN: hypothetical protein CVT25_003231 [Psilocybe cyanescens]|uniref:Uncharacterized protein n=1 Tax=Psilocybe cyanescens TaxID=93625 RepID=A0A409VYP9_PSICY|nr:LOW QUALITY PROTEIN: hypothetical protein CVT25_003231 [Psilocybe cyanescens]
MPAPTNTKGRASSSVRASLNWVCCLLPLILPLPLPVLIIGGGKVHKERRALASLSVSRPRIEVDSVVVDERTGGVRIVPVREEAYAVAVPDLLDNVRRMRADRVRIKGVENGYTIQEKEQERKAKEKRRPRTTIPSVLCITKYVRALSGIVFLLSSEPYVRSDTEMTRICISAMGNILDSMKLLCACADV